MPNLRHQLDSDDASANAKLVREADALVTQPFVRPSESFICLTLKRLLFAGHLLAQWLQFVGLASQVAYKLLDWENLATTKTGIVLKYSYLLCASLAAVSVGLYYGIPFLGLRKRQNESRDSAFGIESGLTWYGKILKPLGGMMLALCVFPLFVDIWRNTSQTDLEPQPIASIQGGKALLCTCLGLLFKGLLCFAATDNIKDFLGTRWCWPVLIYSVLSLIVVQFRRLFNANLEVFCHTKEGPARERAFVHYFVMRKKIASEPRQNGIIEHRFLWTDALKRFGQFSLSVACCWPEATSSSMPESRPFV